MRKGRETPVFKDCSDWSDDERRAVRAEAIYSGYDVIESEDEMTIIKAPPMVRHKPKRRFFA